MPKTYVVEGTQYNFPDEMTDEQVHSVLVKQGVIKPPSGQHWSDTMGLVNPAARSAVDLAEGAASGAASTVFHAGDLIRRGEIGIANALGLDPQKMPKGIRDFFGLDRVIDRPEVQRAITAPDTLSGKVGKVGEQIAEFAVPATGVAKLVRGAPVAARLGTKALTAGTTAALQTGGDPASTLGAAATEGVLGGVGEATPALVRAFLDKAPRPLSEGALALAQKFGIPVSQGAAGGSRAVQGVEKILGSTVAPDLYEGMVATGQKGLNRGAAALSGDFVTDRFTAGQNTASKMLQAVQEHTEAARAEYANLAKLEARPAIASPESLGTVTAANRPGVAFVEQGTVSPTMSVVAEPPAPPVFVGGAKQRLAPLAQEMSRRMTPAQRRADPGLAAIQNILTRPDYLPPSVAEGDLSYLKEILRSDASAQAKRLAGNAIDALETQVQSAVAKMGPDAVASLERARGSWKARSEILDTLKSLTNDETGKTGQVLLSNKLLQPGDASYPALRKVLAVAPDTADDLGKAYLTERVFKKVSADGADFSNPKEATNLWNLIGKRTKAALYTPEQVSDINSFLELGRRLAESPNPSNTGMINAMVKMGLMVTHPVQGAIAIGYGRKLANVLYNPEGAASLRALLSGPNSPAAAKALQVVKSIADESASTLGQGQ